MPGVEVEERHEEVNADCGSCGDDEVGEDVVAEMKGCRRVTELGDYNVNGCEDGVCHDDGVTYEAAHKHFLGSELLLVGSFGKKWGIWVTLEVGCPWKG